MVSPNYINLNLNLRTAIQETLDKIVELKLFFKKSTREAIISLSSYGLANSIG